MKVIHEYKRLGTYRARKFHNTNCIVGHARPVRTEALIFIYPAYANSITQYNYRVFSNLVNFKT